MKEMRGMLLTVNSGHQEVEEGTGGRKGGDCGGNWRPGLAAMGLRSFLIICLLLLADAQKWPVNGDCRPCKCFYNMTSYGRLRSVNCSQRGLRTIPANLPRDLMALDLSWNSLDVAALRNSICKFKSLQSLTLNFADLTSLSDILKDCSTVLEINLTGNRLNEIDSETFQGLKNLRRLLGLEVDTILKNDVFDDLTDLKDLDLRFHGKSLPDGLFEGMVIQSLNLVLTQAAILPQGIFQFGQKTLNALELVGERVKTLHEDLLDGLSVLRKLYLTMPSVQRLPERFFHSQQQQDGESTRRANLQEVEISGIKTLPPRLFNHLVNLETLQLREIGSFPQTAFLAKVINLYRLTITGSKLTRIPAAWFLELYSLKTLKLSRNQLKELDEDAFKGLLNLNYLDLSYNNLHQITGEMLEPLSRALETLRLTGNYFTEINGKWMNGLHSLRYLDVSENRLTNINADSFVDMTYLSTLYLNNNRLTSLPNDLFKDQIQLESLSVADNYLVEFPEAILKQKNSLVRVDLSSNMIKQVPAFELCQFTYLERVNLVNNNLSCDCPMFAFHLCPKVVLTAQCQTPQKYLNMHFKDIVIPDSCKMENRLSIFSALQNVSKETTTLSQQIVVPEAQQPESEKGQVTGATQKATHGGSNNHGNIGSLDQENSNGTIIKKLFPEETDSAMSPEWKLNKTSIRRFELGSLAAKSNAQNGVEMSSSDKDVDITTTSEKVIPSDLSGETDDVQSKKNVTVKEASGLSEKADMIQSGTLKQEDRFANSDRNEDVMIQDGPFKAGRDQASSTESKNNAGLHMNSSQPTSTLSTLAQFISTQPILSNQTQELSEQPLQVPPTQTEPLKAQPTSAQPRQLQPSSTQATQAQLIVTHNQSVHTTGNDLDTHLQGKVDSSGLEPLSLRPVVNRSFLQVYPTFAPDLGDPPNQVSASVGHDSAVTQKNVRGDDENSNQNSEKVAFNFTISALASMLVFGCALLAIFAIHRWQQKGSYITSRQESDEDTEMNNLDAAGGDEAYSKLQGQKA